MKLQDEDCCHDKKGHRQKSNCERALPTCVQSCGSNNEHNQLKRSLYGEGEDGERRLRGEKHPP